MPEADLGAQTRIGDFSDTVFQNVAAGKFAAGQIIAASAHRLRGGR